MIFNFKLYSRDIFIFIKLRNVKRDVEATKYHLMHIREKWNLYDYDGPGILYIVFRNGTWYDGKGRKVSDIENEKNMKFIFSLNPLSFRSCISFLYRGNMRRKIMNNNFTIYYYNDF